MSEMFRDSVQTWPKIQVPKGSPPPQRGPGPRGDQGGPPTHTGPGSMSTEAWRSQSRFRTLTNRKLWIIRFYWIYWHLQWADSVFQLSHGAKQCHTKNERKVTFEWSAHVCGEKLLTLKWESSWILLLKVKHCWSVCVSITIKIWISNNVVTNRMCFTVLPSDIILSATSKTWTRCQFDPTAIWDQI